MFRLPVYKIKELKEEELHTVLFLEYNHVNEGKYFGKVEIIENNQDIKLKLLDFPKDIHPMMVATELSFPYEYFNGTTEYTDSVFSVKIYRIVDTISKYDYMNK